MSFQVRVLARAGKTLMEILAYVAERSPQGAAGLLGRFQAILTSLEKIRPCHPSARKRGSSSASAARQVSHEGGPDLQNSVRLLGWMRALRVRGAGRPRKSNRYRILAVQGVITGHGRDYRPTGYPRGGSVREKPARNRADFPERPGCPRGTGRTRPGRPCTRMRGRGESRLRKGFGR